MWLFSRQMTGIKFYQFLTSCSTLCCPTTWRSYHNHITETSLHCIYRPDYLEQSDRQSDLSSISAQLSSAAENLSVLGILSWCYTELVYDSFSEDPNLKKVAYITWTTLNWHKLTHRPNPAWSATKNNGRVESVAAIRRSKTAVCW